MGDAADQQEEKDGNGLRDGGFSQEDEQQERQQKVEVFLDAERQDVREGVNRGVSGGG